MTPARFALLSALLLCLSARAEETPSPDADTPAPLTGEAEPAPEPGVPTSDSGEANEAPPEAPAEAPAQTSDAEAPEATGQPEETPAEVETVAGQAPEPGAPAPEEQAAEAPASSEEAPPSNEEAPARVEEAPAPVAEEPALVEEAPAPIAEEPASIVEETPPEQEPIVESEPEPAAPEEPPARPRPVAAPEPESPPEPLRSAMPAPMPIPDPMNELAVELGWNAPNGLGVRYLRRIEDTTLALGGGLAPFTMWGFKLTFSLRHAEKFHEGSFWQGSVSFLTGDDDYEHQSGSETVKLRKTSGRTLDFVYGYRWALTGAYFELFTGWSFNLRGTFLQNTDETRVLLTQEDRDSLNVQTPGGLIVGLSYGWRF